MPGNASVPRDRNGIPRNALHQHGGGLGPASNTTEEGCKATVH